MHTLAVVVMDEMPVFEVTLPCQLFGSPPPGHTGPWYDLRICAEDGPRHVPLRGSSGHGDLPGLFGVNAGHGLDGLRDADTIVVPASADVSRDPSAPLLDALREAHERGARIVSLCSGAFVLAAADLLDGRASAVHWKHAETLARRFPRVPVDPAVLYHDHGDLLTGAGCTAGIDLCLHLIRHDLGAEAATAVARHMIVPPHRSGGQAQYVASPMPRPGRGDGLGPVLDWGVERLHEPLTVADLASRAGLTVRTLHRRFHTELGVTPLRWLLTQRVLRARELLERTDLPVDAVAVRCGLGSAPNLRAHFSREMGVSPSEYRRAHRTREPAPA
ncbi:GlxA family transcriptional regulator [Actinomadura harenae]|uniref:Helix-turn-helix domain-containing protein n=1 Tax=Actinomadura harenae TaxID=2483351 RepID=A0A3M2MGF4_9ACTN|nr:helix-turn-helix domain-containing protein [Actinomadura harenae]RMI47745.1 helix-turn-helix domain-containing protein [Actinomadura harenae]